MAPAPARSRPTCCWRRSRRASPCRWRASRSGAVSSWPGSRSPAWGIRRPEFTRISVTVTADNPREDLEQLIPDAQRVCYVTNTLRPQPDLTILLSAEFGVVHECTGTSGGGGVVRGSGFDQRSSAAGGTHRCLPARPVLPAGDRRADRTAQSRRGPNALRAGAGNLWCSAPARSAAGLLLVGAGEVRIGDWTAWVSRIISVAAPVGLVADRTALERAWGALHASSRTRAISADSARLRIWPMSLDLSRPRSSPVR